MVINNNNQKLFLSLWHYYLVCKDYLVLNSFFNLKGLLFKPDSWKPKDFNFMEISAQVTNNFSKNQQNKK
jgi:hypothetical protein